MAALIVPLTICTLLLQISSIDAAANIPLVRDDQIYNPLSCNNVPFNDCSTTTLESIIANTPDGASNVRIPCGTCATLSTSDGSTITLSLPLDVEGMLLVPSTAHAKLRTPAVFVQGVLQIDPPDNLDGLEISLYGSDDVMFTPHVENSDKCPAGGCNVSSKAIVVAGGKLDVRGDKLAEDGSSCKTWSVIEDMDLTDPILPSDPSCAFDGSMMQPIADGTFESGSKDGFQRYRSGIVDVHDDGTNKYLHNYGRSNAKDGLMILFGNSQTCIMRNRFYTMKIKYRLNDEGTHQPLIELFKESGNTRLLANLDLPASVNGGWAVAEFQFNSFDTLDYEGAYIRLRWPSNANATADYDDISINPILHDPPGPPDVLFVDPQVASCWASKVGTELLVTSNEIGQLNGGWDGEEVAVIESIDTITGAIKLASHPLLREKTSASQDARFATELAPLHRSTLFVAEQDNPLGDYIGAHSIILHTTVPQNIMGIALHHFGQQGKLGRYPIHFHMSGDHPDSIVAKNIVRKSHQRCIVIHGTDSVLIEENVAYDTIGHCYMNENGVEENIMFRNNLGALTKKQPKERLIGESDERAYTFWFSNPNVKVEGNVAAGANMGGYWYETFEHAPHGPYGNATLWPEYQNFNPKIRPFGTFINNVVHSNGERGIRMYEPGYASPAPFTFYNTRVYKNFDQGIFIHGVRNMTLDGGVFADNFISIRNFNPRTIFKNLELIGTTDLVRQRNAAFKRLDEQTDGCFAKRGIQQKINPGLNEGAILENITFSGLNEGNCYSQYGIEFYHLLGEKFFEGNTYISDINVRASAQKEDVIHLDCRWQEEPFNIQNILLEDPDGTVGVTGNPGFYLSNTTAAQAFIPDAACIYLSHGCGVYCDNVCLRNVQVKTELAQGGGCRESCYNHTMVISNGLQSFSYQRHQEKSDDLSSQYEAVLPAGNYEITFYNQDGILDESIVPTDILIKLGDKPKCIDHLEDGDIGLKTEAPTIAPTTFLPEPLYSETILLPGDPIVKLGVHDFTKDPDSLISGYIATYQIYQEFANPAFSVKPSQYTCSIIQSMKLYTSYRSQGRDPTSFILEGYSPGTSWNIIAEGPIDMPSGRNVENEPVSAALYSATVPLANVNVYREYRLTFPTNGGSSWLALGQIQFTGFFTSCDYVMAKPTLNPTFNPSTSPSNSPTSNPSPSPSHAPQVTQQVDPPLYATSLLEPTDNIVKLGTHSFTTEPYLAIDGFTTQYKIYQPDWANPAFSVTPKQTTIVQEMRVYAYDGRSKKDPREYKLEGRLLQSNDWTLIKEGLLPDLGARNANDLPIDETTSYGSVSFSNTQPYNEYRLWFPSNRGNAYWIVVSEVSFGGFYVYSGDPLTTPYPKHAICESDSQCASGFCNVGVCD